MLNLIIGLALLGHPFTYEQLTSSTQPSADPIRMAKAKYILMQQWKVKDPSTGQTIVKEEKVCEGEVDAPVVYLKGDDGIPAQHWKIVECSTEPHSPFKTEPMAKTHILFNFFVIFMDYDIFAADGMTKNFVSFVQAQNLRDATSNFISSSNLQLDAVAFPTDSEAKLTDSSNKDWSRYTVSARIVDVGEPPTK